MGWLEFLAWTRVMKRQLEGEQTNPDSWDGRDSDPWWQEQDRVRAAARQARDGF